MQHPNPGPRLEVSIACGRPALIFPPEIIGHGWPIQEGAQDPRNQQISIADNDAIQLQPEPFTAAAVLIAARAHVGNESLQLDNATEHILTVVTDTALALFIRAYRPVQQ